MSVTRVDWWLGVAVVAVVFTADGCWPRFEWHAVGAAGSPYYASFDRWTGHADVHRYPPVDASATVAKTTVSVALTQFWRGTVVLTLIAFAAAVGWFAARRWAPRTVQRAITRQDGS